MSTNNPASSAQGGRGRNPQGRTQALASISVYPDLESPGLSISGWKAVEEMGFCKIEFGTWHNGACTTTPNSTSDGFYILGANGRRRCHSSQVSLKDLEPLELIRSCSWHCPTTCQSSILAAAGPGTGHNTQVLPHNQTHRDFCFHESTDRALAVMFLTVEIYTFKKVSAIVGQ